MAQTTASTPSILYVSKIPESVKPDFIFHVSGTPERKQEEFTSERGPKVKGVQGSKVIRNSFLGGTWGEEEIEGDFPFQKGQKCKITIQVEPHRYSVFVDSHHFCDYHPRVPPDQVTHVTVHRGFRIEKISLAKANCHAVENDLSKAFGTPNSRSVTVYNPKVPFIQGLGNVSLGKMFYIGGILDRSPSRIIIEFGRRNDLAFHISIRFNESNDRNVIVRNTRQDDTWGTEETSLRGNFPFQPDQFFDMIYLVEPSCFKVAVNNQNLLEFIHRIPFHVIDTLTIKGDVRLTQVRF